jgi:hypothetical protein
MHLLSPSNPFIRTGFGIVLFFTKKNHFQKQVHFCKMLSSSVRRFGSTLVAKKAFSSVSPKIAIGQHILRLDEIFHAADEAALTKIAASPLPSVDPNNLPAQLKDLASWYALDNVSASDKFIPDPDAWQNKKFWDFVVEDAQRNETWPFLAGFV